MLVCVWCWNGVKLVSKKPQYQGVNSTSNPVIIKLNISFRKSINLKWAATLNCPYMGKELTENSSDFLLVFSENILDSLFFCHRLMFSYSFLSPSAIGRHGHVHFICHCVLGVVRSAYCHFLSIFPFLLNLSNRFFLPLSVLVQIFKPPSLSINIQSKRIC